VTQHIPNSLTGAIRRSLPPPLYVVIAVVLLCVVEAIWFSVWLSIRKIGAPADVLNAFVQIRDGLIAFLLVAYGVFRVVAFHPLFLRDYSTWLERTPWQPGLPLPLGPVRLAWPDLIVAGGLALLLEDQRELLVPLDRRMSAVTGLLLFMQAHATMLAIAVWLSRPRGLAYAAAFLIALGARLSLWSPLAGVAALVAAIVTAHVGLNQSWSRFPWVETSDWLARLKTGWRTMQMQSGQGFADDPAPDRVPPTQLGWPFGICSPYVAPEMISTREKMLLAALLGFWIHALLAPVPPDVVHGISWFILFCGGMVVLVSRLATIGDNHLPPINLAGRFFTLRWIVPRYDMIVIPPLCMVVVPGIAAFVGHDWLEIRASVLVPAIVTLTMWTGCLVGPSSADWKLTAPARLVPGRQNKSQFEELS
jgi:hypothetical protein